MGNDRWKARAKGGILRREFLGYAGRFAGWAATVWASAGAGEFLAQRRERVKKSIVIAAEGRAAGTAVVIGLAETAHVTGIANLHAGPATLSASGTVSNPPDPGDLSSHIA
jgi:hypothetical protein